MNNDETFWIDGMPFHGIRTSAAITTASEFYWIDGVTVDTIFPLTNIDTGKMIIMFE